MIMGQALQMQGLLLLTSTKLSFVFLGGRLYLLSCCISCYFQFVVFFMFVFFTLTPLSL